MIILFNATAGTAIVQLFDLGDTKIEIKYIEYVIQ